MIKITLVSKPIKVT